MFTDMSIISCHKNEKKNKYEIVVGSRVLWMLCSNGLLKSLFRIFKAMINNFVPSDK